MYEKQKYLHAPDKGVYGDCYRTCLAGMLGMPRDYVPHYVNTVCSKEWAKEVQPKYVEWLTDHGWQELEIPVHGDGVTVEQVLEFHKTRTEYPTIAMLNGVSRNGCGHVVLVSGGEIIHDPAIDSSGIVGPQEDGFYWLTWLLPTRRREEGQ